MVMLHAEGLEVRMGERVLVQGLDLVVAPGQLWGVLGRNGAGKSTLLHVLAGLRRPHAGQVSIDGDSITQMARRRVARRIGVLLQEETRDYWGSTREYAMLGRFPHLHGMFGPSAADQEAVDHALESMDLVGLKSRGYRSLSGGERQRARLAALLAQKPGCYLCDEPLQQLDLAHQVAFFDCMAREARRRQASSVMVLHDLVFANRHCERILLLFGDGRYLTGTREEMLTEEHLSAMYGFPVEVRESGGERIYLPASSDHAAQL